MSEVESCLICQDDCGHTVQFCCKQYYHKECLAKWLEKTQSCAICRKPLKRLTVYVLDSQIEDVFNPANSIVGVRLPFYNLVKGNNIVNIDFADIVVVEINDTNYIQMVMFVGFVIAKGKQLYLKFGKINKLRKEELKTIIQMSQYNIQILEEYYFSLIEPLNEWKSTTDYLDYLDLTLKTKERSTGKRFVDKLLGTEDVTHSREIEDEKGKGKEEKGKSKIDFEVASNEKAKSKRFDLNSLELSKISGKKQKGTYTNKELKLIAKELKINTRGKKEVLATRILNTLELRNKGD